MIAAGSNSARPPSALAGVPMRTSTRSHVWHPSREFATGETLMSEGHFGHFLFLIETGTAEATHEAEQSATSGRATSSARLRFSRPVVASPS